MPWLCPGMFQALATPLRTYTQDNYYNPRCACAPRVNDVAIIEFRWKNSMYATLPDPIPEK